MKLFINTGYTLLLLLTWILTVRCWSYIGCRPMYDDTKISPKITSFNTNQPALSLCFNHCGNQYYPYFTVNKIDISAEWDPPHFVVQCHCYLRVDGYLASCNFQCQNSSCGGQNAMSAYSVCDRGRWGWDEHHVDRRCDKQCHCAHGAICRVADGLCPNWHHCADTYRGYSCNKTCDCDSTVAPTCNKWNGQCNCIPGRYGTRCDLLCHCAGGAACRQSDGQCPGECEGGYWGDSCSSPCDCGNGVDCQKQDGQCNYEGCPPGKYGTRCDTEVPYYMVGCFAMDNIRSAVMAKKLINAQEKDIVLHQCRSICIQNKNGYFAVHPSVSMFTCYCLRELSIVEGEECPHNQLAASKTVGIILVEVYTTCPLTTYDFRGDGSCNMRCLCDQAHNWSGICTFDGTVVACGTCSSGWIGYHPPGWGMLCPDDDECMGGNSICGPVGECHNTPGSYHCQCPAGYQPTTDSQLVGYQPTKSCVDINECTDGVRSCQKYCQKFDEYCLCEKNYILKGNDHCTDTDLDECKSVVCSVCGVESYYVCGCLEGYTETAVCPDSVCTNTEGSYICGCLDGYTLSTNNTECLDIDECLLGNHTCQQICTNDNGSYICSCEDGYILNYDMQSCIEHVENHTRGLSPIGKKMTTGTLSAIVVVVILVVLAAVVTPTVIFICRRRKLKDGNDESPESRNNATDCDRYATVDEDVVPDETVTNGILTSHKPGNNIKNSVLVIIQNMDNSINKTLQPSDEIVAYENITCRDLGNDVITANDNQPTYESTEGYQQPLN